MDNQNDNSEWGWENIGPEAEDSPAQVVEQKVEVEKESPKSASKAYESKPMTRHSSDSLRQGIPSSPSFQELERAIGATLAQSMNGSETDMTLLAKGIGGMSIPKVGSFGNMYKNQANQQRLPMGRGRGGYTAGVMKPASQVSREELSDFIREVESRAIILFHSVDIPAAAIKEACQKLGTLYYIRPEFHSRGVTFLSYFDLRNANEAVATLSKEFSNSASAHYSIMLHGTNTNTEEYKLVIKHLPITIVETELESIFSRYGEVRSIERKQPDTEVPSTLSPYSYYIEYFDIQDARIAFSELSATSSQIWGASATVTFAPISQNKQNLSRQLLNILSRWRNEGSQAMSQAAPFRPYYPSNSTAAFTNQYYFVNGAVPPDQTMPGMGQPYNAFIPNAYQLQPQMSYQQAMNPPQMRQYPVEYAPAMPYQISHVPPAIPAATATAPPVRTSLPQQPAPVSNFPQETANIPDSNSSRAPIQYRHQLPESRPQHHNGGGQNVQTRRVRPSGGSSVGVDAEFLLDIHRLQDSSESRTTIMVRNIPNKYTQRMLLEEVDVNHKGTYDFFYLPIDFKNRCNVGYCFINFLEPRFILAFVEEFNGRRWKNFNSEKVCAVTFARIQGRTAMISRFQNSSLLDKNDDYRPLLFYSSGPERGKPEPFPTQSRSKLGEAGVGHGAKAVINGSIDSDFHDSATVVEHYS